MGFIADPNAGPTPKIPDGGVLYEGTAPASAVLSKTVVSRRSATGLSFRISCDVDGAFVLRFIDSAGRIRQLQASTAYTAASGVVTVPFAGFVEEALVEFTAGAPATALYIEGWANGPSY